MFCAREEGLPEWQVPATGGAHGHARADTSITINDDSMGTAWGQHGDNVSKRATLRPEATNDCEGDTRDVDVPVAMMARDWETAGR